MDSNPNQCAQASGKVIAFAGLVLHAQSDTNEAICSKSYPSITASKASRAAVRIFMFRLAISTIRANMQLRIARVLLADATPRNFCGAACLYSPGSTESKSKHDYVKPDS